MYSPASLSPKSKQLRRQVSEGPIAEFVTAIEESQPANWQKRSSAFQKLVEAIPENAHKIENGSKWYSTPATLRHLAISIGELLKDPRSTVVKRTCLGLTSLFERCKVNARYLFKDLMPSVLSVHAQTVQVIRQAVENMVLEAIHEVPCKMIMPLWMERLRIDRSRTVRDACALYLGHALQNWNEEGYLTDEIWFQVGRTLLGSVRDPSPNVRTYSKQVLEQMERSHPSVFDQLLNDESGPAGKDPKLFRWLKTLGQSVAAADAAEDLSVASRFSYNSDMRMRSKTAAAAFSPANKMSQDRKQEEHAVIPDSISLNARSMRTSSTGSVGSASQRRSQGTPSSESPSRATPPRPPPSKRTHTKSIHEEPSGSYKETDVFQNEALTDDEDDEQIVKQQSNETDESLPSFPSNLDISSWRQTIQKSVESSRTTDSRYQQYLSSPGKMVDSVVSASTPETPHGFRPTASTAKALENKDEKDQSEKQKDATKISNVETLKKFSKRRSRSSLLIQERLRVSSSVSMEEEDDDDEEEAQNTEVIQKRSDEENNVPNPEPKLMSGSKPPMFPVSKGAPASSVQSSRAPEHMVIAIRLLRAHKEHVDTIMETLRIEMDTLRDFDQLLEEAGRPTEEEVLDYYESVGLCLEQRSAAGAKLQSELDRVSRGEPPME